MIWKIVLVLGVAVGLNGDEEAVSEQKVTIHHPKHAGMISHAGDKQENHKDYEWSYPSYEFSYKVKDPHTHDIKGQTEERDGDKVKGDYWLIEPTGRKRIVKYHADDEIGFNAHVDYTKSDYSLKEKNQNNQVESSRLNSQEDEQLQLKQNNNDYKVTEGNRENENNNEKGESENSGDQKGNIQEEVTLKNQEENGGADVIEQNQNNNNNNENENQLPINDAMITLEALNENIEPQCNCRCNERPQIDYKNNINEVKNNNNGGQEITSRRKRKNINRSTNFKSVGNGENIKHIELDLVEKNQNKKLSHSDENKKSQNNNLNDKKKKNDNADFGSRTGKRKQIQTRDQNKYEDQQKNNTVKNEEIKDTKSENINENENENENGNYYQHRILIHHPKFLAQKASKRS